MLYCLKVFTEISSRKHKKNVEMCISPYYEVVLLHLFFSFHHGPALVAWVISEGVEGHVLIANRIVARS